MTRLAVLHRVTHPRCTVLHAEPPKTTWEFVGYFTKQRERRTDKWGRLDYDDQNIAEPAVFTDSAKAALAITAVARELGVPEDSIQEGLREIDVVLPGLELNPGTRARLAADVDEVVARVVHLKELFPGMDVPRAASSWPPLLELSTSDVSQRAASARHLLRGCNDFEALIARCPRLLDADLLGGAVATIERLFKDTPPGRLLEQQPEMLLLAENLEKEPRNDYDDVAEEAGKSFG